MPLTYRASAATASGGISLSTSMVIPNTIQVGDLIMWTVVALENTRGWGGGISGAGTIAGFTDLSTAGAPVVLNGRSQYQFDDGVGQRAWWWIGYKIATVADTGGPTYTGTLVSAPAAGVGVAQALVAYSNPGGVTPVYSVAVFQGPNAPAVTSVTSPAAATPPGNSGTFLFNVSATNAGMASSQTTVVFGDAGDYHVVCLPYGLGGNGLWVGPAGLTDRVRWGGLGGPWYMLTWSDGPTAGSTNLGRLPLLGAG